VPVRPVTAAAGPRPVRAPDRGVPRHDIGYFFYNGGNGSAETAHQIATVLPRLGWPVVSLAVPKTIDNDIVHSDSSPGFGSVAKFVATSMREAMADLASMANSSTKVFVMEVMGRYTGWIAAACGLALPRAKTARCCCSFPRSILTASVSSPRCAYALRGTVGARLQSPRSETARRPPADPGRQRRHTRHEQLGGVAPVIAAMVRSALKVKVHWGVLDYVQRAARHLASQTDVAQAYAVGRAAITCACRGKPM